MNFFARRRKPAADTSALGLSLIAMRLDQGDIAPAPCTVVRFNAGGQARRVRAGRIVKEEGETVFCFHPGPFEIDLAPFAQAPEWGLRLRFLVDAANPRLPLQRFDLYLYSEVGLQLGMAEFRDGVQAALRQALAQGSMDLPPCTSLEEWNSFRAGLNQLLYTRFGVIVDDCLPIDLGPQVDYAAILRERALYPAPPPPESQPAAAGMRREPVLGAAASGIAGTHAAGRVQSRDAADDAQAGNAAACPPPAAAAIGLLDAAAAFGAAGAAAAISPQADARALRRLFLELPALAGGLRQLLWPPGLELFRQQQELMQRLHLASLDVNTMPSLAWAAPDRPLPQPRQARRIAHSLSAAGVLDEGWALLARLQLADPDAWTALLDDADRICANLEHHLAGRRAAFGQAGGERKEPAA